MEIHEKLNIPEGLHGLSLVQKAVKELRWQICLQDIPSPTVPEYVEHHESIREILKFTDEVLEIINSEIDRNESIKRCMNAFYGAGISPQIHLREGMNYADADELQDPGEVDNAGL